MLLLDYYGFHTKCPVIVLPSPFHLALLLEPELKRKREPTRKYTETNSGNLTFHSHACFVWLEPRASIKKRKEFKVNGVIYQEERYRYYFVDRTADNQILLDHIIDGNFVRMYAPRASGKSSRVMQAIESLMELGFKCY